MDNKYGIANAGGMLVFGLVFGGLVGTYIQGDMSLEVFLALSPFFLSGIALFSYQFFTGKSVKF